MTKTILHIDDEADIRELLADFFTANGYRVISVATRTEALKAVEKDKPDLIITDLQLEEADGLDTVEQLRKVLPDTPVALLTGVLIDPHVVRETVGRKVSVYLEKTLPLTRILAEVRNLIGS